MKLFFRSGVNCPLPLVRDGFSKDLFLALSPSWPPFELLRFDGCRKGDEVHVVLRPLGMPQRWESVITENHEDATSWSFTDEGKVLPWPLGQWKHRHRIDRMGDAASEITDDIEFKTSPRFLAPLVYPFLWAVFSIRPRRYKTYFEV